MHFSPKTVNDGLVFHYDTGNTVRSFRGEPTTNVLNNNILGTGNGASLSEDSTGTYIQLANLTSSYSRFQLPSIPVSSNDTYTWSFELMSPETITTNFYFDTNEYSDQFPASNDLSRASATARVPSAMPAGVWQEFSLTVTMKDGLTGAYTYDFFNMLYPTFQNKKVYYRNMQFEFKDHPTQYAGQGATRSATQGLLDLTGRSKINMTDTTFNSSAQIEFDGTNARAFTADPQFFNSNSADTSFSNGASYEFVIKAYGTGYFAGVGSAWRISAGSSNFTFWDRDINAGTSEYAYNIGNLTVTNNYVHVVGVLDPVNGEKRFYINGVEELNEAYTRTPSMGTTQLALGKSYPNSTAFCNCELPVGKVYTKALTADEVKRNFTAIRSRFNI